MGHEQKVKEARRNDGAEFEAFIERVERVLAPSGALVERNARVADIDTGEARDVDVWIRQPSSGGRETKTMIECRDRVRPQDVMWIEQLMGKRISVGADVVVAVTRKPVTGPARIKAEKRDIQLRCLRDLNDLEILGLVKTGVPGLSMAISDARIMADCDHGRLTSLALTFVDGDATKEEEAPPEVMKLLAADPMRSAFLFDEAGRGLSVERALLFARLQGWDPTRGGAPGAQSACTVRISFAIPMYIPVGDGRRRQVAAIEIGYAAERRLEPFDLTRHAYEGTPDPTKILAGTWTAPDRRNEYRFTMAVGTTGLRADMEAIELPTPP